MAKSKSTGTLEALLVAILVTVGVTSSADAAPTTYTVVIDQMSFGPTPPSVRVGDVIEWVNKDIFEHSATAQDGSFDVDLASGKRGATVLNRIGTVAFSCKYHPGMKGRLVVTK